MYFIFSPHLTCASALPGETGNPKFASFHLNAVCFYQKNTWNTLKYHLVTAESPFTVKTIDWMYQTGPRILLSVIHMLYVNQVRHDVSRCVKDRSCSSSSLSKSQWTVLVGYLTISTNVRRYQTHHRWKFFFQEDNIVRATQSNCCSALD